MSTTSIGRPQPAPQEGLNLKDADTGLAVGSGVIGVGLGAAALAGIVPATLVSGAAVGSALLTGYAAKQLYPSVRASMKRSWKQITDFGKSGYNININSILGSGAAGAVVGLVAKYWAACNPVTAGAIGLGTCALSMYLCSDDVPKEKEKTDAPARPASTGVGATFQNRVMDAVGARPNANLPNFIDEKGRRFPVKMITQLNDNDPIDFESAAEAYEFVKQTVPLAVWNLKVEENQNNPGTATVSQDPAKAIPFADFLMMQILSAKFDKDPVALGKFIVMSDKDFEEYKHDEQNPAIQTVKNLPGVLKTVRNHLLRTRTGAVDEIERLREELEAARAQQQQNPFAAAVPAAQPAFQAPLWGQPAYQGPVWGQAQQAAPQASVLRSSVRGSRAAAQPYGPVSGSGRRRVRIQEGDLQAPHRF